MAENFANEDMILECDPEMDPLNLPILFSCTSCDGGLSE